MPITKTVSGLYLLDELDELNGWELATRSGNPGSFVLDTSDKYSGAASFHLTPGTYPSSIHMAKNNMNGPVGYLVRICHKATGPAANYISVEAMDDAAQWRNLVSGYPSTFCSGPHAWAIESATIPSELGGVRPWGLGLVESSPSYSVLVDKLVVCTSASLTVAGLTPGQKVEIYRASDDALIDDATCPGGQTSVSLDISAEDFPKQMYLKVYGTDGATLIETTTAYEMCGGDTWAWTSGAGTLSITVDADIIYRSAAVGTPKTCNITANLKTLAGANYPGATIYFTTTLGAVSSASDVTDANGNAETALTSTMHGIAVIMVNWLGDETVPACSAYYTVHVFYEAEVPDTTKKFQFYCQGIEYTYVGGCYTLNELGVVNDFEIEIPEWVSTLTMNGYVNIYRLGVKEFHGILKGKSRSLSDSPRVTLKGPDVSTLLNDRVVDTKIYSAKTAAFIIDNLLTSFPCGIAPGTINTDANSLTITIETESLVKAIPRICDLVNWHYRVSLSRTLDFAETFSGGTAAASFVEGTNILSVEAEENYYPVANYVRMKGSGITSTKSDGTKIQEQGLHQAPVFNKSISNQATLDTACQAYLDMKKTQEETIRLGAIDEYDPGTFGPEDYVTVTSPYTGLSGTYQIRKIERTLTEPYLLMADLSNRTKTYWELDEAYRRMTKDASI